MSVHSPTTGPDTAAEGVVERPREFSLPVRMAAEAAGTFILVLIGVGALLYSGMLREVDPLINALSFGVAFAAAVGLFARVSGGHSNPAISLGAALTGQLRWADLPAYWLGQLLGALAAAAVLYLTIPAGLSAQLQTSDQAMFGQTANTFGDLSYLAQVTGGQMSFSVGGVLALEALGAAVLTAVALVAAGRSRALGGPVLAGLTLTGLLLLLEPVSGGSVNPARSTASAIFAEPAVLGQLWLFWLAPLIGGAVAGLAYLIFSQAGTASTTAVVDAADPWDDEESWAEEKPWEDEDPWEGDALVEDGDAPEGEDPSEGDALVEDDAPAEGEDTSEGDAPVEGEDTSEDDAPADGQDSAIGPGAATGPAATDISPLDDEIDDEGRDEVDGEGRDEVDGDGRNRP